MPTKPFVKELRDAAMACSNADYRKKLRDAADELDNALRELFSDMDESSLRYLNGCWVAAKRVLAHTPPEADPTPPVAPAVNLRKAA